MGGMSSVIAVIFGIFWTAMAFRMTAGSPFDGIGSIFPLFGILFIVMGVANAIYNFRNATSRDRYSMIDITDSESEPDPLNELFGRKGDLLSRGEGTDGYIDSEAASNSPAAGPGEEKAAERPKGNSFCPYCGERVADDYRFCPKCGRDLPG